MPRVGRVLVTSVARMPGHPLTFEPAFVVPQWHFSFEVSDGGTIAVPAGTFETLTIDRSGGPTAAVFYVTRDRPRRVVRLELVGVSVVMELVR